MNLITILLQIEKEFVSGQFTIPALPAIAMKVKEAVQDPEMDMEKLAKVVSLDPPFTAFLINIANSPLFRGVATINSIPNALGRIGLESTRNSAMIFAVRSLLRTRDPLCKRLLTIAWNQSRKVAAFSYVIAQHLKTVDPDRALVAGLFHNIGMIPMLVKLAQQKQPEQEIMSQWTQVAKIARNVGVRVLAHWGLEEDLKAVAKGSNEWTQDHDEPMVDLVNLAIWHSFLGKPEFKSLPKLNELSYFRENPMLETDASESLLFVKESREELDKMMHALNG
ncbi:MAG: HDOD domain-containing protein [Kangiellaceae bacterium]|nr:HDOD domain-containing protein [Kangiellaceae bacterium]